MRYSGSRFDRRGFSVPGGPVTLSLFFLFLIAIGLLFVHRADPSLFERWRTKVVDISAPVLETLSWPVNAVRNGLEDLGDFWDVYEENKRLQQQIEDLKVWQAAALHYERQIAQYKKLLKVLPPPGIEYVTARLIADAGSPFKHTFILNAGARQGIANGQGVVNGLDLIGRVVNVGKQSSRVLSVTDINSRIPVMVEPSRQRAIMAGDNTSLPKLEFVESELDIRAGDRVVTSGDGGLLPAGLPIGVVVQQEAGKFRVKPNASHGRFEAVRVVRFKFPVDVNESEAEGAEGSGEGTGEAAEGDAPESAPGQPAPDSEGGAPTAAADTTPSDPGTAGQPERLPAGTAPVRAAENAPRPGQPGAAASEGDSNPSAAGGERPPVSGHDSDGGGDTSADGE